MLVDQSDYTELINDLATILSQPLQDHTSHSKNLHTSWQKLSSKERTSYFGDLEKIGSIIRSRIEPLRRSCFGDFYGLTHFDVVFNIDNLVTNSFPECVWRGEERLIKCVCAKTPVVDLTSELTPGSDGSPIARVMQECVECLLNHCSQLLQHSDSPLAIASSDNAGILLQKSVAKRFLLLLLILFEDLRIIYSSCDEAVIIEMRQVLKWYLDILKEPGTPRNLRSKKRPFSELSV